MTAISDSKQFNKDDKTQNNTTTNSSDNTKNTTNTATNKQPTYTLEQLEQRKLALQNELNNIEQTIYELETSYLEDTSIYGNVIKGWDNYNSIKGRPTLNAIKKHRVPYKDRLFSHSSATAVDSNEIDPDIYDTFSDATLSGRRSARPQQFNDI